MERRRVLKSILAFLGTTSLVSLLYPLARFFTPPGLITASKKLTFKRSEIPPGTAKDVIFNDTPIVIINRRGKGFIALSRECTHLGCLVGYDKDENLLVCPCHAGLFTAEGSVISGPAPSPLQQYPLTINADTIILG